MPFNFLSPQIANPVVDVVFVHGLRLFNGAPQTDWRSESGEPDTYWPEWLREDFEGIRVGMLSYDASAFMQNGHAMHLEDRALNVLSELRAEGVGKNPVVFITHSLGGLVVKEMLLTSKDLSEGYKVIADSCRGVAFLATPHYGAPSAKHILTLRPWLRPTEAIETLSDKNMHLTHLMSKYRTWVHRRGDIKHLALRETRKTKGIMVVPASSSDPGLATIVVLPVDADHNSISSPESRDAYVYKQVKLFLEEVVEALEEKTAAFASEPVETPNYASTEAIEATREPRRQALKEELLSLESRLLTLEEERAVCLKDRDTADYLDATHLAYIADKALLNVDREIERAQLKLREIPYDIEAEVRADDARSRADRARTLAERKADSAQDDLWSEV